MAILLREGPPHPCGATWVELCLFDVPHGRETERIERGTDATQLMVFNSHHEPADRAWALLP